MKRLRFGFNVVKNVPGLPVATWVENAPMNEAKLVAEVDQPAD